MPGPILISSDVEGAEAALEVAAALDELAGAVAAFEIHAEEGGHTALWRGGGHPPAPAFGAPGGNRAALPPAGGRGPRGRPVPGSVRPRPSLSRQTPPAL